MHHTRIISPKSKSDMHSSSALSQRIQCPPTRKAKEEYEARETFLSQTEAHSRIFIKATVLC